MIRSVGLAIVLFSVISAARADVLFDETFHNWRATVDQDAIDDKVLCYTRSVGGPDDVLFYFNRFSEPSGGATWLGRLKPANAAANSSIFLRVAKNPAHEYPVTAYGAEFINPARTDDLMDELAPESSVLIRYTDARNRTHDITLPLDGFTAARTALLKQCPL